MAAPARGQAAAAGAGQRPSVPSPVAHADAAQLMTLTTLTNHAQHADDARFRAMLATCAVSRAAACRWRLLPKERRSHPQAGIAVDRCPCGCGGSAPPSFADWYGYRRWNGDWVGARLSRDGLVIHRQCGPWRGDALLKKYCVDYRWLPVDTPLHGIIARVIGPLQRGEVQLLCIDSSCYIGSIDADGLAEGWGVHKCPNGDRFEGTWRQGQLHRGVAVNYDGDRYEGSFKNGLRDGVGRYKWKVGGKVYEGGFKAGKKHGLGVLRDWAGKALFCGGWENDKFTRKCDVPLDALPADTIVPEAVRARLVAGRRLFLTPEDTFLVAESEGDQPHGAGVEYDRAGVLVGSGDWQDGKRQGLNQLFINGPDGRYVLERYFSAGQRDGAVRITYPDGRMYEGGWREGAQHTRAPWAHRACVSGLQSKGSRHGFGVLFDKDGSIYFCGVWENDEPKPTADQSLYAVRTHWCDVPRTALPPNSTLIPAAAVAELDLAPAGRDAFVLTTGNVRVCPALGGQPIDGEGVEFSAAGTELKRGNWAGKAFTGRATCTQTQNHIVVCEWEVDRRRSFFLRWTEAGALIKYGFRFADGREVQCAVPRSALLDFDALPESVKAVCAPAAYELLHVERDNSVYVGVVEGGQPSGPGVRIYPNGSVASSEAWSGEQLVECTVRFHGGGTYEGQQRDGSPNGVGLKTFYNGSIEVGEFLRDWLELGVSLDSQGNLIRVGGWEAQDDIHDAPVPVSLLSRLSADIKLRLGIHAESTLLLPPGYIDGACSYAGQLNGANEPHGRGSMRDANGRPIKGQCGEWTDAGLTRSFHALLIGNAAAADVQALRAVLESLCFLVTVASHASDADMKSAVAAYTESLQPGAVSWVHSAVALHHSDLLAAVSARVGDSGLCILTAVEADVTAASPQPDAAAGMSPAASPTDVEAGAAGAGASSAVPVDAPAAAAAAAAAAAPASASGSVVGKRKSSEPPCGESVVKHARHLPCSASLASSSHSVVCAHLTCSPIGRGVLLSALQALQPGPASCPLTMLAGLVNSQTRLECAALRTFVEWQLLPTVPQAPAALGASAQQAQ